MLNTLVGLVVLLALWPAPATGQTYTITLDADRNAALLEQADRSNAVAAQRRLPAGVARAPAKTAQEYLQDLIDRQADTWIEVLHRDALDRGWPTLNAGQKTRACRRMKIPAGQCPP